MSEFLKSAMGYFNAPAGNTENNSTQNGAFGSGAQPGNSNVDNKFIGQLVEITGHKLRVKRVIAEGGFAFVYVAQDLQTGKKYALKRLLGADKLACDEIINEINTHKMLSGHPNIITFIGATSGTNATGANECTEYLLLSELCRGTLSDYINMTTSMQPALILRIIYQAARAIAHMHSQVPHVIHLDIKVDNFLIGSDKQIKLCDFGSTTKQTVSPTIDWNAEQRNMLEEDYNLVTTPMYRAPEIVDVWSNYEIGPKVDVWALGCVLYVLCFGRHPFEDSSKLRIMNGNYILPSDVRYNCFHDILKGCFIVNPTQRYNITMVLERLAALAETNHWSLRGPIEMYGRRNDAMPIDGPINVPTQSSIQRPAANGNSTFYTDNPDIDETPTTLADTNSNASLFSSIRGGAGSFLKNLKDTSAKVMQTMQQTIARTDLDISYITSRVLVMPCPSEGFESAYKTNNIEDVRLSIESRFALQKISIYNFGPHTVPRLPPPVRTVEVGSIYACPTAHAPNLHGLYSVAEDMYGFLNADAKSVIIIQTSDSSGCVAATIVCALLMYADLLNEPEDAVQVFAVKRHTINLRPSEFRYLYYFGDILRPTPLLPHYKTINLVSLSCRPVPRMTKARDGCRIYMEVYCNERLLLNTISDYENIILYLATPGRIVLPINLTVCGDLIVVLYHARRGMVRPQGIKICQFQINTGFVPEPETLLSFNKNDLDDVPDNDQVSADFKVSLSLSVTENECLPSRNPPWYPPKPKRNAQHLFSSQLEYEEMLDNFVTKPTANLRTAPIATATTATTRPEKPSRPNSPLILPDVTEISHNDMIADDIVPVNVPLPEPTPPIDLLNLDQPSSSQYIPSDEQFTAMPSSDASFDLLGAFGDDESTGIGHPPIPDILPSHTTQSKQSTNIDDIFGSLDTNETTNFNLNFGNLNTTTSKSQASQINNKNVLPPFVNTVPTFMTTNTSKDASPQVSQQSAVKDPFADIANLASGLNINFNPNTLSGKSAGSTPLGNSPLNTQFSSPMHNINIKTTTKAAHATKSPQSQHNNGIQKPDYSRMHFEAQKPNIVPPTTSTSFGTAKNEDIFADILGSQGYKFGNKTQQGPRSINEMRKEELIKDMDPERVRIMEWTDGKKNNIRALLCSMHTVLWDNAKWTKCEMSTLVTPVEVKKAYRRACLAVHPDKHNGTQQEGIAKLVFMELNNAWTDFENDATQQNMFNT